MSSPITPERLRTMFRPKNVALVGASNKSSFSFSTYKNFVEFGKEDHIFLVNPRGVETHGRSTYTSINDVPEPIDLAFMMVPQAITVEVLREVGAAGVRNAVIMSSGYAEAGEAGRAAQAELVAAAEEMDMLILGPNMLGFANLVDGAPGCVMNVRPQTDPVVGLLSQSGASTSAMIDFAEMTGVGLSYAVTLGNEAMITAGHVLDFLVDDEATKAIAMFVESIRDPHTFLRAARRATEVGKPVVVLKAGASELAARTAMAHTGALVGDDKAIEAMFRELGVIRVGSVEDLMLTAGAAAHLGPLPRRGIGIASISGGACDILADEAERIGCKIPEISEDTHDRIGEFFANYGTIQNPLDVTGAAIIDPTVFQRSITSLADDPSIGVVMVLMAIPWEGDGLAWPSKGVLKAIGDAIKEASVPVIFVNQVIQPTSETTKVLQEYCGIPYVSQGMTNSFRALHNIDLWSRRRRALAVKPDPRPVPPTPDKSLRHGEWTEAQARDLVEAAGIPVVPALIARHAGEAITAARELDEAVAVKVISPEILHKSDIGGVRLNVKGDHAVLEAFEAVTAAGRAVPGATVEGALLTPMRSASAELLIGVVRDADFGLMLAVAFGGVFVEILHDSILMPLPVTPRRATQLLRLLKGDHTLDGFRGSPPADRNAFGEIMARVGDLALALGDDLESLELNPIRVNGSQIEALDVVVEWTNKS